MDRFFTQRYLNKEIPIPFYYQLKELLLEYIAQAEPGSSIPTETQLCEHFDISRTTVRQALGELTSEGLLYRQKGKGTMILPQKIEQEFLYVLESFNDEMQHKGLIPNTKVLSFEAVQASSSVASALGIEAGDQVLSLTRVRSTNGEPIVLVSTYLPAERYGLRALLQEDLEQHSLYERMKSICSVQIEASRRTLEIRQSGSFESEHLHVKPGSPLQYIETVSTSSEKIPIEYSRAYYRSDKNKFVIEITRKRL